MSKPLIIAEKKNLAMDIATAIGGFSSGVGFVETSEYIITWVSGHALQQADPKAYGYTSWTLAGLPINHENIIMVESKEARFKKQLSVIKKNLKTCDYVVHAGDPDREGQLIIDELLEYYKYKGEAKRLLVSDNNTKAIMKALDSLEDNNAPSHQNRSKAAQARSIVDWEVGMNLSPAMTLLMGNNETMSVGRVQTAILRMIVDRHRLIHGFAECKYHVPVAKCTKSDSDDIEFQAEWVSSSDTPSIDDKGRILDIQVAEDIAERCSGSGVIKSIVKSKKKVARPLGYTLSKLYIDAGRMLKMSPEKAMEQCQSLYDQKKVTTYPRVNCPYLPTTFLDKLPDLINAIKSMIPELSDHCDQADLSVRSKIWNDKEVTAKAHHALCVTGTIKGLTNTERGVFKLIAERILMQFMPIHELTQTVITVESNGYTFSFTGKHVDVMGWRAVTGGVKDTYQSSMDQLKEGDIVTMDVSVVSRKTNPPKPYTGGTIVEAMCNPSSLTNDRELMKILKRSDGLGTEATRPSFVPKLLDKKLIEKGKHKDASKSPLIPLKKGIDLIEAMESMGAQSACDPATTAIWEMCLGDIEAGGMHQDDFIREQRKFLSDIISTIKKHAPDEFICPKCSKPMAKRKGAKGIFYGCTGYKDGCKSTMDENGKSHAERNSEPKEYGDTCPLCQEKTVKKEFSEGQVLFSCEGYFKTKCRYSYKPDAPKCPDCGARMSAGSNGWWCRQCSSKK